MVTYGKGGWDWKTVYTLPVFLRTMYFKKMSDALKQESDALSGNSSTSAEHEMAIPRVIKDKLQELESWKN